MRAIALRTLIVAGTLWTLGQPVSAADVKDVLGACDRTPGCNYTTNKAGDVSGCSANACFYCAADGKRQCTGVTKARTAGAGGKGQIDIGGVKLDRASSKSKAATAIREHQAATSNEMTKASDSNKSGKTSKLHKTDTTMKSDNKKSSSSNSNDMKKVDHDSSQKMQSSNSSKKH